MRDDKDTLDMTSDGITSGTRGAGPHAKVKPGRAGRLVIHVISARLRFETNLERTILLIFPVVATFDQTALELLRNPAVSMSSTR